LDKRYTTIVLRSAILKLCTPVYPVFLNAKKTTAEGRRIAKSKAVENPTLNELAEVCKLLKLECQLEVSPLLTKRTNRKLTAMIQARQSLSQRLDAERKIASEDKGRWKIVELRSSKQ